MLAQRAGLDPMEHHRLSELAQAALIGSDAFQQAQMVLIYAPFRGEVAIDRVEAAAVAAGKGLTLPRVHKAPRGLTLHAYSGDPTTLAKGAYAIPEPRPEWPTVAPGDVDLVVVPGVAFDPQGNRLGYGGGYYDRFLPELKAANPGAVLLGLAFGFQVVGALPRDPHDVPLDGVATDRGLLLAHH